MSEDFKINYNAAQRKAKVEFQATMLFDSDEPPPDMLTKVKERLETEILHKNIDIFITFEKSFKLYWEAAKGLLDKEKAGKRSITFLLGQGGREIPEIVVEKPSDNKSMCNLTFKAPSVAVNNWRYEWVVLNILHQLKDSQIAGDPHLAQIRGAWLRACQGEKVEELGIASKPTLDDNPEKPFKLMANKGRREVVLAIHNRSVLFDKTKLAEVISSCNDAMKKVSGSTGDRYQFLKADLSTDLREAISGPEGVGVNLPIVLLVGLAKKKEKPKKGKKEEQKADAKTAKSKMKEVETYKGIGRLKIAVSQDLMEAFVEDFDMELYGDNAGFELTESWLKKEIDRFGVVVHNQSHVSKVMEAIVKKTDVSGMVVSQGKVAKAADGAYLHQSFKDIKVKEGESTDLRDMNQNVVKAGDLVCQVKYKIAAIKGQNVYGEEIEPPEANAIVIDMGEGIELKGNGKYYATTEGQPVIEDKKVSISELFLHKGNINLKSGNVYFNGPAKIEGNIERGASVVVKGDLLVTGSVENAFVRSGGSITVIGGITTGDSGRVQARDDLIADYIGNSSIVCGGNLEVKKAVISSKVIVGGNIRLNLKDGTLAGGTISCRGDIEVAKFGFPKGEKTICFVGVDWRAELSLQIKKGRIEKIKVVNEVDRKNLRELVRKKGAQLTAKHRETIEHLKAKLQRQREIMDSINEKIEEAESLISWDKEVQIFVHNLLCSNVDITVGGNQVAVPGDVAGVVVSAKRQRGSHVQPMEDKTA